MFFFFNDPATTEIYTYCHTLSLHDALPIYSTARACPSRSPRPCSRPQTAEQLSSYGRDDGLSDIGGNLSLVSLQVTAAIHLTVRKGGGRFEGYLLSSRSLEKDTSPRTSGPRLLVFV